MAYADWLLGEHAGTGSFYVNMSLFHQDCHLPCLPWSILLNFDWQFPEEEQSEAVVSLVAEGLFCDFCEVLQKVAEGLGGWIVFGLIPAVASNFFKAVRCKLFPED